MKYIYVLEDEAKFRKQIYEALRKTDAQCQIRFFHSFEDFKNWIPSAIKSGKEALAAGGQPFPGDVNFSDASKADDELTLLISKDEWLGSRYMSLVQKTQELFIRKGLCGQKDPTRLVITAFENPSFDIKLAENRIISNVLFKPFDELILQQHLNMAISGHNPASQVVVHTVQTEEQVEMTKEVQLEAVGDVGFVTSSPREIKVGQVSKYYGDIFKATGRTHVMGRCIACEKVDDGLDEFRVWFSYFGIPSRQISEIRQSMMKRKDVEFSANLPAEQQADTKRWVILDPKPERAQKMKKVLEEAFNAQVEHMSSFESFSFHADPLLHEKNRKEPHWVDLPSIKITFDLQGEVPKSVEPSELEHKRLMGWLWEEFVSKRFSSRLHAFSVATWKDLLRGRQKAPQIILVQNGPIFFPVQVSSITVEPDKVVAEFSVPMESEKLTWFEKQFPSIGNAHALIISEEFLTEDRLGFWEKFREGKSVKYYSLHTKIPDENMCRQLKWMEDLFEESNDPNYLRRKFNWIYGLPVKKGETRAPFLNANKELIRVANPVEVAELSEAGLIINYYRPISLGAFRQFVLSKPADTFFEYRAVCNYTCEHPSEKDLHQNYFVFFGVTDLYLKNIRLWIRDNYVQSKQKDNS